MTASNLPPGVTNRMIEEQAGAVPGVTTRQRGRDGSTRFSPVVFGGIEEQAGAVEASRWDAIRDEDRARLAELEPNDAESLGEELAAHGGLLTNTELEIIRIIIRRVCGCGG